MSEKNQRKKEAIRAVESGSKTTTKHFKIPLNTLCTILKNKEKTVSAAAIGGRKCTTRREFLRLEEYLVTWLKQYRSENIPVSDLILKEKAIAKQLNISNFMASDGWVTNVKNRNSVYFKKLCGESASVDEGVFPDQHGRLTQLFENYKPCNIFNTDETGLLCKYTFAIKDEKSHGGKHNKEG